MFIGHYAPALIAAAYVKKTDQARSLGTLFLAGQLVDFAFFIFVLMDIEKFRIVPGITRMIPFDLYYLPYSHSLLGVAAFAALFAVLTLLTLRDARLALASGIVVLSHWFLDLVVHRPDLTFAGGDDKFGWGLWNYPWIAIPLETVFILGAFFFYAVKTRQRDGKSDHALYTLLAAMVFVQAFNWFGPEPGNTPTSIALSALATFAVMTGLAAWLGSTREYWRLAKLDPPSALPTRQ